MDKEKDKNRVQRIFSATCESTAFNNGIPNGKKLLIVDRDPKFTAKSRGMLRNEGIESLRLPSRTPNTTAHIERYLGSLKSKCLHRLILVGERSPQCRP